jgi:FkbM family methyltransferase
VTALGLERSAWGRRLLARLNIVGEKVSRLLVGRGRYFTIDGHKIYLAGRFAPSVSFSSGLLAERYEQDTVNIYKSTLLPGMRVVDVGAHVGLHALLAARLVGSQGKVYAFEASPDNFALLEKNITSNGYQNIVAVPAAVAEKTGTVTFHLSPEGNDRNSIYASSRVGDCKNQLQVPAVSLDDFLEKEGWPGIDFVKIDVEGAEPLVLKGMSRFLERSKKLTLIVEFAPACIRDGGVSPTAFLEDLASRGFRIRVLRDSDAAVALPPGEFSRFAQQVETEGMANLVCEK